MGSLSECPRLYAGHALSSLQTQLRRLSCSTLADDGLPAKLSVDDVLIYLASANLWNSRSATHSDEM